MSDLTEFLLARVAEDEAVARAARGPGTGEWASWNRSWDTSPTRDLAADGVRVAALPMTIDEHVCRHDPARVLAECEAKRRIVSTMQSAINGAWQSRSRVEIEFVATRVLRALASIYAEHPDYREEWRP